MFQPRSRNKKLLWLILPLLILILSFGCTTTETISTTSTSTTPVVTGVVIDGYISGATVCLDKNYNKQCDSGEPSAITDANGVYIISQSVSSADLQSYSMIAVIPPTAIDSDYPGVTIGDNGYILTAPKGSYGVITPLTTLVNSLMEFNSSVTQVQAANSVQATLGIESSVDLFKDYIVAAQSSSNAPYIFARNAAKLIAYAMNKSMADMINKGSASIITQANGMVKKLASTILDGSSVIRNMSKTMPISLSAIQTTNITSLKVQFTDAADLKQKLGFNISGKITLASGLSVLSGTNISLVSSGVIQSTTMDPSTGTFSFSGIADSNYIITPSKAGYTFSPLNQSITVQGLDITLSNFVASASPSTGSKVYGTVTDMYGRKIAGVTATLIGVDNASSSVITLADGGYAFTGAADGIYTIQISKTGWQYAGTPSYQIQVQKADFNQNFTGGVFSIAKILRTGQDRCWDNNGILTSCAGTGQDADLQRGVNLNPPGTTGRFAFDPTGFCVIDNLTGLMWPKNLNLIGSSTRDSAMNSIYNSSYQLLLCGYSDWRMPNVNQLRSLFINQGSTSIALPIEVNPIFFTNFLASTFWWSSTNDPALSTTNAFIVTGQGGVYTTPKTTATPFTVPVRVYSTNKYILSTGVTQAYNLGDDGDVKYGLTMPIGIPRFEPYSNNPNCIIDNLTGLMWAKDPSSAAAAGRTGTWQAKLSDVIILNEGPTPLCGFADWRMPNLKELQTMHSFGTEIYLPNLYTSYFSNIATTTPYWVSTSHSIYPTSGLRVFFSGVAPNDALSKTNLYSLWITRGGLKE